MNWKATLKYDHSRGAMVYQTPMSIIDLKSASQGTYNYQYRDINGQERLTMDSMCRPVCLV